MSTSNEEQHTPTPTDEAQKDLHTMSITCIRCEEPQMNDRPMYDAKHYVSHLASENIKHKPDDQICVACAYYYKHQHAMQPKPDSRIKSLEKRAATIEAAIIEMSHDTAGELKAIRQDISNLEATLTEIVQRLPTKNV